MAYNLSAFAGAGAQFFDSNGDPLVGGLLYVYTAGTVTPATTWTSNSGAVANTNPIVLDAAGRTPNQIWLNSGVTYKFILKTSTGVTIGTYDNIPAIDDPTVFNNLITVTGTNTLIGTSVPPATAYVAGMTISFVAVNTNTGAVTIDVDGLGAKNVYIGSATPLSGGELVATRIVQLEYDGTRFQLQTQPLADGVVTTNKIADGNVTAIKLAANSVTTAKIVDANVTLAKLSATGTPSATTFLRGDNTWSGIARSAQVFTSNGTFTIPASVTAVKVTVVGGGGGSGGAINSGASGGGGGGGTAIKWLTGLTPGNTITVTIGAAGTAGAATPTAGGAGGNSSISSGTQTITTVTANGGSGSAAANAAAGAGASGGATTNGDAGVTGQRGVNGFYGNITPLCIIIQIAGSGGGSIVGPGGNNGAGTGYGAGAGGVVGSAGNAGTAGAVIFEW